MLLVFLVLVGLFVGLYFKYPQKTSFNFRDTIMVVLPKVDKESYVNLCHSVCNIFETSGARYRITVVIGDVDDTFVELYRKITPKRYHECLNRVQQYVGNFPVDLRAVRKCRYIVVLQQHSVEMSRGWDEQIVHICERTNPSNDRKVVITLHTGHQNYFYGYRITPGEAAFKPQRYYNLGKNALVGVPFLEFFALDTAHITRAQLECLDTIWGGYNDNFLIRLLFFEVNGYELYQYNCNLFQFVQTPVYSLVNQHDVEKTSSILGIGGSMLTQYVQKMLTNRFHMSGLHRWNSREIYKRYGKTRRS